MRKILLATILIVASVLANVSHASTIAAPAVEEEAVVGQNEGDHHESGEINPKEILFGHLLDNYGWEYPFNHHKRIPLPIIVIGEDGFHCFSSARLEHGATYRDGDAEFRIATDGPYKGKVVEIVGDSEVRPWDISITKNACAIFVAALLLIITVLAVGRWSRKNGHRAPRKFLGAFEALVEWVYNGVIVPVLGKDAPRFANYLLTAFFFILYMNLLGLIVIFPGGANLTGNIAVTLVLALFTFFITNFCGKKHYWKEILWPDVPWWLKCPFPLFQIIEIMGMLIKPVTLSVRLFANMLSGHLVVLVLTLLIFLFASFGAAAAGGTAVFSILFSLFMLLLDVLVSFIQAYVFTMLSTLFIGAAVEEHEEHKEHEADPSAHDNGPLLPINQSVEAK